MRRKNVQARFCKMQSVFLQVQRGKRSMRQVLWTSVLCLIMLLILLPGEVLAAKDGKLIYDEAGLLTVTEYEELHRLAEKYGAKRETDIMIFTTNNPDLIDVEVLTQNFYDEYAPGYDKPHGNTVILTLDMGNRDVYLAGFYKAKTYLDDGRLDKIRERITPDLSSGDYSKAFATYIKTAHKYMGFEPNVNPDNPLFNIWFQLIVSVIIGGFVVCVMVFGSGGRVTVNRRTYEDAKTSGVIAHEDRYIRTTVKKRKIEKNTGSSGGSGFGGSGSGGSFGGSGFGGGSVTRGGHSHSSSRGKF